LTKFVNPKIMFDDYFRLPSASHFEFITEVIVFIAPLINNSFGANYLTILSNSDTGKGFCMGSISFTWKRIDSGDKHLAGNWRITQRKQGDQMVDIPLRARRTLKLLTATRFQWAAINVETGEFFGTGGGTYSFQDGKYTENIEFFSRDDSRVGMSLTFDGKLDDGKWIHSGKSSKGDPIYEVWERFQDKK